MAIAVTATLGILESIVALKSMNVLMNHVGTMEIAWSAIKLLLFDYNNLCTLHFPYKFGLA